MEIFKSQEIENIFWLAFLYNFCKEYALTMETYPLQQCANQLNFNSPSVFSNITILCPIPFN